MKKIFLAFLMASQLSTAFGEEQKNWELGLGFSHEKGKFGTTNASKTTTFPFSLKRFFERGDIEVRIPYVILKTTGQTTLVNGRPRRIRSARVTTLAKTGVATKRGLGDILLNGHVTVTQQDSAMPSVALLGSVKCPTASSSEGLGTGEWDGGGGLEISQEFLERAIASTTFTYTHIGSPPGEDFKNQWSYGIDAGYKIMPKFIADLYYSEDSAILSSQANARSIGMSGDIKIADQIKLNASAEAGLTTGAPDYNFTAGLGVLF